MPRGGDARGSAGRSRTPAATWSSTGPFATDTTYTRVLGGTTMHWEAKTPRMLPEDFDLRSRYGVGRDWPLSYEDLTPFYAQAEREIGVSAEVENQTFLGVHFEPDYVYPMHEMPPSYLDQVVAKGIDGTFVEVAGEQYELRVRTFPQGRNGIPNPAYDGGKGFVPIGAVSTSQVDEGGRCQGNTNCVPDLPGAGQVPRRPRPCPRHWSGATSTCWPRPWRRGSWWTRRRAGSPASKSRRTSIPARPGTRPGRCAAGSIVLGASAIENARLMLASGLPSTSGLVGRNLMDHAYLLNWGLLPEIAGTFRGTVCTGGIVDLRTGPFRRRQAAFAVDIHNDGWGWATGSPYSDLVSMVDDENLFGRALRSSVARPVEPPATARVHGRRAAE